jgi:NAD(P)H-hydrate epimerase
MAVSLSRAAAREHDRRCIETLGIPGIVLMENAAAGCVRIALDMLGPAPRGVLVACGPGQNGGDGYAIARHLANAGHAVRIVALGTPPAGSDAGIMRTIVERMGLPLEPAATWSGAAAGASLTVDALFGTGLDRDLGEPAVRVIRVLNGLAIPILAIDLPSGLDADTGHPRPEAIRATATATMVAPKVGMLAPGAAAFTGRVETVAIGGPPPGRERKVRA